MHRADIIIGATRPTGFSPGLDASTPGAIVYNPNMIGRDEF